jgi:predicted dehydrogenase
VLKRKEIFMKRRELLKSAMLGAPIAMGFPMIVPSSALGRGATPPSDRILLGSIGLGRMGGGNTRGFLRYDDVRVAAVCDVQEARREQMKKVVDERYGDQACSTYNDFRELLARKDLDAVMIATGERWHPLIAIEAARLGKHMYCEKPMARTVEEAKAVRDAIRRSGVVFQLGTMQRSSFYFRHACELVRNGKIGQLQTIAIASAGGNGSVLPPEVPSAPPEGVDWDMWLGPAPWAPYSELRISLNWLDIYDYGLGLMGGSWGIHELDIAQWVNNSDRSGPVSVEGTAEFYHDIRDTASSYDIEYKYANGVRVNFMDLPTARKRFWQFQYGSSEQRGYGDVIIGSEGWIFVSRESVRTHPEALVRTVIGPNEIRVRSNDHKRNFLDAIKNGREPISHIEAAVRGESMCQIGDIAIRLRRKLRWDPEGEQFPDDAQANRRLSRPMRSPWRLETPGAPRSA